MTMAGTTESTACSKSKVKSKRQSLKGPKTLSEFGVHSDVWSKNAPNRCEVSRMNCDGDAIAIGRKELKSDGEEFLNA